MDSIRCTERLVVTDERRPAIASRVPLPDVKPAVAARVVRLEDIRAERARRPVLERFQRRSDLARS